MDKQPEKETRIHPTWVEDDGTITHLEEDITEFEQSYASMLDFKQMDEIQRHIFRSAYVQAIRRYLGVDWGYWDKIQVDITRYPSKPKEIKPFDYKLDGFEGYSRAMPIEEGE